MTQQRLDSLIKMANRFYHDRDIDNWLRCIEEFNRVAEEEMQQNVKGHFESSEDDIAFDVMTNGKGYLQIQRGEQPFEWHEISAEALIKLRDFLIEATR